MKWTYLYGGENKLYKPLDFKLFSKILESITKYNDQYIKKFMNENEILRSFNIVYSQQMYLQKTIYTEKFASQLKLFKTIKGRHDIEKSFEEKTGIKIFDFLHLIQITWLYTNLDEKKIQVQNDYLTNDYIDVASQFSTFEKVEKFIQLLVLDPINPNEKIRSFKRNLRKEELQSVERTFFTLFPLQYYNKKIRIIHPSILKYSMNYYIYDYLKSNDEKFTTEFGNSYEKYIEFGLKEIGCNYIKESELKDKLPEKSRLVDFVIDSNLYIECKAIEAPKYPSAKPTDELIYNSLKDSLIKAYYKQLIETSSFLNKNGENWGIILTYKELYWSQFSELHEIMPVNNKKSIDTKHLPPENVFIIDFYTWDIIINIISNQDYSLIDILKFAKQNNSNPKTMKKLFHMHLDELEIDSINLSYLKPELKELELKIPN